MTKRWASINILVTAAAILSCNAPANRSQSGTIPLSYFRLSTPAATDRDVFVRLRKIAEEEDFAIRTDDATNFAQMYREDIKLFAVFKNDTKEMSVSIFRTCACSQHTDAQIAASVRRLRSAVEQELQGFRGHNTN